MREFEWVCVCVSEGEMSDLTIYTVRNKFVLCSGRLTLTCLSNLHTVFLSAGAHAMREWLVLRLLHVFRVCLSICASGTYHIRNTSYVTMQLHYIAAFGGL